MTQTLYHYPSLSDPDLGIIRGPGPGLGNLLFPIARALVGQKILGGLFVYPTLRQIKLGPFLRGERDLRTYGHVLRPRSASEWRVWLHSRLKKKSVEADVQERITGTIIYSGMRGLFNDLQGHERLINEFLNRNSTNTGRLLKTYDLAIHIRRGDFLNDVDKPTTENVQLPLEWYRKAYEHACKRWNLNQPSTIIFTDGDHREINAKLGVPNLLPEPPGHALAAILNMSRATYLIGSRSTFSLWGAYLGQMPSIWPMDFQIARSITTRPRNTSFL